MTAGGTLQPVSVQTFAPDGSEVEDVRCEMSNDEGTWFVMAPGSTIVRRSNKDLQVSCKKAGMDAGFAAVASSTKANIWGNMLAGGGVGVMIDHNNGSAYEYPGLIKISMERASQHIEEKQSSQAESSIQQ